MIDYIRGRIAEIGDGKIVLDVCGFGLQIIVPSVDPFLESRKDQEVRVFLCICKDKRKDILKIYGFLDKKERDFFLLLLGVSGVGPKIALNIISAFSLDEIETLIKRKDCDTISQYAKVGKRVSQRIVYELSDKIPPKEDEKSASLFLRTSIESALLNLGYSKKEAKDVTKEVISNFKNIDVEKGIKEALKILSK